MSGLSKKKRGAWGGLAGSPNAHGGNGGRGGGILQSGGLGL